MGPPASTARRAGLVLAAGALLLSTWGGVSLERATRPDPASYRLESCRVFLDRNGRLLRFVPDEAWRRHLWVELEVIPEVVRQAFIAAEDERFYRHPGFDPVAMGRALLANLRAGRVVSGASTLTQQLVKMVDPGPRTVPRKLLEVVRAARLETAWSKEAILTAYLNRVDLGNNLLGVEAAARAYFGKSTSRLTAAEAALLAALPKAPSALDPHGGDRQRLRERRNWVLARMAELGSLDRAAAGELGRLPLGVIPLAHPLEAPHAVELLLAREGPGARTGEIRTTLDRGLQRRLESVLASHRRRLLERGATQAAAVLLDNRTRGVLALAGSLAYGRRDAGYVNGTLARRSAGSTLKPFLYGLALESGYTAATVLEDLERTYRHPGGEYVPRNYDRSAHGPVNLRRALGRSLNLSAVAVLLRLGVEPFHRVLLDLELLDEGGPGPDHFGLGLAVGNAEVRLLELAAAYAALADGGRFLPARLLADATVPEGRPVFSPRTAFLLADILADPLVRPGVFEGLALPGPVSLKTGTSTRHRDCWTVGFTDRYTVGVWVGNFEGSPTWGLSGAAGAGPIFADILKDLYRHGPPAPLPEPPGLTRALVCAHSGSRPHRGCPEQRLELFTQGTEPRSPCSYHGNPWTQHDLPVPYAGWLRDRHERGAAGRYRLAGLERNLDRLFAETPPGEATVAAPGGGPVVVGAPGDTSRADFHPVRIVHPLDGDRYVREPGAPGPVVHLRARCDFPADQVTWFVDGVEYRKTAPPYETEWRPDRGRHTVIAVGPGGFGEVVTVAVE